MLHIRLLCELIKIYNKFNYLKMSGFEINIYLIMEKPWLEIAIL